MPLARLLAAQQPYTPVIHTQLQTSSSTAETQQTDSTEKTALAVAATAAVDLTNLFFLLRGDTDTDAERRRRRWGWTGGICVLFAFAALLSAAGTVLAPHVVSVARRRVLLVASAAALFVASAGTVLFLLLVELDA